MPHRDEIWYAATATRVVLAPQRDLETFGQTSVHYYVVTELLDAVNQIRVRQGKIVAERPRVIMPRYFVSQALENFGKEAQQYVESLLRSTEGLRILEYGLRFRKEEHSEEVIQGEVNEVADQVAAQAKDRSSVVCGVVIGVDDLWEVSLLKFMSQVISGSAAHNIRELAGRGLLDAPDGTVPNAVRVELESDFRDAAGSRDRLEKLGKKLRDYGVFKQYEDRFFGLLRSVR